MADIVDAARVWQSGSQIIRLIEGSPQYSLTVWGKTTPEISTWLKVFQTKIDREDKENGTAGKIKSRFYLDTHSGDDVFAAKMALLPKRVITTSV